MVAVLEIAIHGTTRSETALFFKASYFVLSVQLGMLKVCGQYVRLGFPEFRILSWATRHAVVFGACN